jgi:hypothetical protein
MLLFTLVLISGCVANSGTSYRRFYLDVLPIPNSDGYSFKWKKELSGTIMPKNDEPNLWEVTIEWNKNRHNKYELKDVQFFKGKGVFTTEINIQNHIKSKPEFFEDSEFIFRKNIKTEGKVRFVIYVWQSRENTNFLY